MSVMKKKKEENGRLKRVPESPQVLFGLRRERKRGRLLVRISLPLFGHRREKTRFFQSIDNKIWRE